MIEKLIKLAERDGIEQSHEPNFGATIYIFKISGIKVEIVHRYESNTIHKDTASVSYKSQYRHFTCTLDDFNNLKRIAHEQLVAKQLKESQEFQELLDSV